MIEPIVAVTTAATLILSITVIALAWAGGAFFTSLANKELLKTRLMLEKKVESLEQKVLALATENIELRAKVATYASLISDLERELDGLKTQAADRSNS